MTKHTRSDYIKKAVERIQDSDGFLLISVKGDEVSVAASIGENQDRFIVFGLQSFIEERAKALDAMAEATHSSIH